MRKLRAVLGVTLALTVMCAAVMATATWMKPFKDTYKPKDGSALAKAKCAVCHTKADGTGTLNPYGKALKGKTADAASLKAVEQKDSDKDGFRNIKEIKAGTLPGDKTSKPAR